MSQFKDLTGCTFGRLTVMKKVPNPPTDKHTYYLCKCICGKERTFCGTNLSGGYSKSCGCISKEITIARNKKDGYFHNESFFQAIDTEIKAYWLGFIAADGSINKEKSSLVLDLASKDYNHLVKFRDGLESNNKIYTYRTSSIIKINSRILCGDLEKFGIVNNKSLTLVLLLKDVPMELHKHFWRGVIDGDGSLFVSENKIYISLVGTQSVCNDFSNFICNSGISSLAGVLKRGNIYTIRYVGNKLAAKVIKLLYQDSSMHLDRKFNIAKDYLHD
jgi:hypothetical protein